MVLCSLKDVEERKKIVAVIFQRLGYRLTDCLECSEMDHCIYPEFREKPVYRRILAAVYLLKRYVLPSRNLLDSLETCKVTIGKIVGNDDIIAGLDQLHSHMAADISGAAGDQNSFIHDCKY